MKQFSIPCLADFLHVLLWALTKHVQTGDWYSSVHPTAIRPSGKKAVHVALEDSMFAS